jgi:hypothetical protein
MKKIIALIISFLLMLLCFIPFETTLVPEWTVRVKDEMGNPYVEKLVGQTCENYTLGVSPCAESNIAGKYTNSDGLVTFPERKVQLSLISRMFRSIFNYAKLLAHGSIGIDVYIHASGPTGYKVLKYEQGKPAPSEMVLPSESIELRE